MNQETFSDIEYANRRKRTRREEFLDTMDELLPWDDWIRQIRPWYPAGQRGRPPKRIDTMLRMFLMQNWFDLSAAGIEDVIYDSYAMRKFMHIDFLSEQVPDSTTLLRFRRLLAAHDLQEKILSDVDAVLAERGLVLHRGAIGDAALASASGPAKKNGRK